MNELLAKATTPPPLSTIVSIHLTPLPHFVSKCQYLPPPPFVSYRPHFPNPLPPWVADIICKQSVCSLHWTLGSCTPNVKLAIQQWIQIGITEFIHWLLEIYL